MIEHCRRCHRQVDVLGDLTPREMDVLRAVASGKTNKQVADALEISQSNVRNVITAILDKFGIPGSNRTMLVMVALRDGVIHLKGDEIHSAYHDTGDTHE